jgi:hypothetical protein
MPKSLDPLANSNQGSVKRRQVKRIVILSLLSPKQFTQKKKKREGSLMRTGA